MKESDPPEVELDESDGTYLLLGRPGEISPVFLEKTKNAVCRKIVDKTVDPKIVEKLFSEITGEIVDHAFSEASRKGIDE